MRNLYILLSACILSSGLHASANDESSESYPSIDNLIWEYSSEIDPGVTTGQYTESVYDTKIIDGKSYGIFKSMNLDAIPVRCENRKVFGYSAPEYNPKESNDPEGEFLLYDFNLNKGDELDSYLYQAVDEKNWYDSYFRVKCINRIIASREINLFGTTLKVQKLRPGSLYNIFVEKIGPVVEYGSFPMPMDIVIPTNKIPGRPTNPIIHPTFSKISTKDGKYSYSRIDLGLRAENQIINDNLVWEYYSENEKEEAVHYMEFSGKEEIDGTYYSVFSVSESIIRDKATGKMSQYKPSDNSGKRWLVRENLGDIYVLSPESQEENLLYDFTLQTGDSFKIDDGNSLAVKVLPNYMYGNQPVKSYSFDGESADGSAVTEFIGISGNNKGFLTAPYYLDNNNTMAADIPAADCTLSRQTDKTGTEYYASEIYNQKVKPLLDSFASVEIISSDDEKAIYYDASGIKVAEGSGATDRLPKGIYIKRQGTHAEKILIK